jgi:hypothetical protein
MTENKAKTLKEQISFSRFQMIKVNRMLTDQERELNLLREEVYLVREGFDSLMKLMNADLLNTLTKSNEIINSFNSKK